jgi:hypothetical protein
MEFQMTQNKSEIATYVGSCLSTSSGLWMWMGENHNQIAAIGVIVGIIVGVVGLFLQIYKTYKDKD